MNTAFSSFAAFFAMGGYAFYVWLAVIVTFSSLLSLWLYTLWQHRQLLADLQRRKKRTIRMQQSRKMAVTAADSLVSSIHQREKQP
jgi:heme exporter protein D